MQAVVNQYVIYEWWVLGEINYHLMDMEVANKNTNIWLAVD